jgi:D-alanine-D-alanine ligase
MKIGITYDLKAALPASANLPDDFQEEFDSPVTIEAIAAVLRGLGHEVQFLGDGREMLERLLHDPPDFVFNIAEGHGIGRCREARVPAVLEMLGIPYTGSDPLTLAATLDKDVAKRLVRCSSERVRVPYGILIHPNVDPHEAIGSEGFPFPAIAKPAWEGSSKGIRDTCLIHRPDDLGPIIEAMRRDYGQPVLLEEYIEGDELTVGVLGNANPKAVGTMRIVPRQTTEQFIYSLEIKRDWQRLVRYEGPAVLEQSVPGLCAFVEKVAVDIFRDLGCRDVARIDFRLGERGLFFLEVNPLPGLNPESSDLVILSRLAGWSYEQLIESILHAAEERIANRRSLRP